MFPFNAQIKKRGSRDLFGNSSCSATIKGQELLDSLFSKKLKMQPKSMQFHLISVSIFSFILKLQLLLEEFAMFGSYL